MAQPDTQINDGIEYMFKYKLNESWTKQCELIVSNWSRIKNDGLNVVTDIIKLIIEYSQYGSELNIDPNHKTYRTLEPFPLNKGKYSFTVTIKAADDEMWMTGDTFVGLHCIGICSEKFKEFDKYVLHSNRKNIAGFGDDMIARGWVTWRYFGDGNQPKAWFECKDASGGYGHNDKITIVVDFDNGWIRGYKNGKRFAKNEVGDIYVTFDDNTKFYPMVSSTDISAIELVVAYGQEEEDNE